MWRSHASLGVAVIIGRSPTSFCRKVRSANFGKHHSKNAPPEPFFTGSNPFYNIRQTKKSTLPCGSFYWRREWDSFLNISKHLGFPLLLCFEIFFGHRSKTLHRSLFSLVRIPFIISAKQKKSTLLGGSFYWRREWDSNP